jgi:tetratricopeptide (TPR) repeat protein
VHHRVGADTAPILGRQRLEEAVESLVAKARREVRVVVLHGAGGTGKSFTTHQFIDRIQGDRERFDGIFFWSSYYSDDAITGVDRLLAYLNPDHEFEGGRIPRLRQCLQSGRYLIVFDGFERLLYDDPDEPSRVGRASAPSIKEFLELIQEQGGTSTILLTTRLWPRELGEFGAKDDPKIESVCLRPMRAEDVQDVKPFRGHDLARLSSLCKTLDGHTYGIVLACRFLARGSEDPGARMKELSDQLEDRRDPHGGLNRMIRATLDELEEQHGSILKLLLERISLFMSPVPRSALRSCYESAKRALADEEQQVASLQDLLEDLTGRELLFLVPPRPEEPRRDIYTVHPTVRGHVFQHIHGAATQELPNFTLPGFTSGTADIAPGNAGDIVLETIDDLDKDVERAHEEGRVEDAEQMCRSTFGLLRSRMEAITAPRWTSYDKYVIPGFRLLQRVRALSRSSWTRGRTHEDEHVTDEKGVLYADEVAWLYNDTGLSACSEGEMADTQEMWVQGYEINQVLEPAGDDDLGGLPQRQYVTQSLLHLGHMYIELGDLASAQEYLKRTEAENERLEDPDYEARVIGYHAVIAHLQDNRSHAKQLYRDSLRLLKRVARNPRARSFFLVHLGNLQVDLGELDEAEESLRTSRSLAAGGPEYPDLIEYSNTCRGYLLRSKKRFVEARDVLEEALRKARGMGIQRLVCDVHSQLARLALDLGDHEEACVQAVESLELANTLGLGLRQSRGLLVLGLASVSLHQNELAIAYLERARILAEEQQCWSRMDEAKKALRGLGVTDEPRTTISVRNSSPRN